MVTVIFVSIRLHIIENETRCISGNCRSNQEGNNRIVSETKNEFEYSGGEIRYQSTRHIQTHQDPHGMWDS